MKRHVGYSGKVIDSPKKVEDFFAELHELYKKYGFALSHEDAHGGFILDDYTPGLFDWVHGAMLEVSEDKLCPPAS